MSSSWATIEAGIHAWAVAGTPLVAANVIWAKDTGPRPVGTYIALSATVRTIGRAWLDVRDADAPVPGAEIIRTARTVKKLSLQIQCFDGSASGDASSMAVISNLTEYASLPSQKALFKIAGWAPAVFDPVLDFSGVRGGSKFEPRSIMTCHGYITGEVSETGTFIEFVSFENQIDGSTCVVNSAVRVTELGIIRVTEAGGTRSLEHAL